MMYFLTIWEFPLFDIIRSRRSETVLFGMKSKSSDGFLVIGESAVPKRRVLARLKGFKHTFFQQQGPKDGQLCRVKM